MPIKSTDPVSLTSVPDIVNGKDPVEVVKSFLSLMQPIHDQYQRQWYLNISNFLGNQYLEMDRVTGLFGIPEAPSWRVRLVVNRILPIIRTQIAKLRDTNPRIYVSPSTMEKDDRGGAKIATKVAQSIYRDQEFLDSRDELTLWQSICGNAYTVVTYDAKAGKEMQIEATDDDGKPIMGEDGKPKIITASMGDLVIDVANPFEVIPDYSTTSWKEQNAMVRRKVRSIDYIKRKYDKDVEPEPISQSMLYELRVMNMQSGVANTRQTKDVMQKSAIVKEMWIMPSEKFPKGRHLIVASGVVLHDGELLTKRFGKVTLPVTHFGAIEIPGRLMHMSPMDNLLQLQWHYNRGRSQIIENINLMGLPKVFAPMDSIPEGSYTDEPGEIVEFNPVAGEPPFVVPPSPLPNYILDNLNRIVAEMEDVGGIHEISLGRLPRRATSGVALSILEEKDNTIVLPMKDSLARGIARTLSLALNIASMKFTEERLSKIVGKKDEIDIIRWTGADLQSQDDVHVNIDQPFPSSRAAKLEFAMSLVKAEILRPDQAMDILELTDLSQVKDLITNEDEVKYAQMENLTMLKGERVSAGRYEDHVAHIKEHKDMINDSRIDEDIRIILEEHIAEHEALQGIGGTQPLTGVVPPATLEGPGGMMPPGSI